MPLRVTNLSGFGVRAPRVINVTVTSSENDFVLYDELAALGANPGGPTNPTRTIIRVRLSNGVTIGSTSTSTAAFRTHDGDTYGSGWAAADCQIIVESGTATIQGKGGAGGNGAGVPDAFPIDGSSGGGGGGGAGTQVGAAGQKPVNSGASNGSPGTASAGGAGGAGSALGGSNTESATAGGNGGVALEASSGGPNITLRPASGATLNVLGGGGGGGGGGAETDGSGTGGAGGDPGEDGTAGTGVGAASGGAHGAAYSTPGSATITEEGPGTITTAGE